jgi:hypothetical protein
MVVSNFFNGQAAGSGSPLCTIINLQISAFPQGIIEAYVLAVEGEITRFNRELINSKKL